MHHYFCCILAAMLPELIVIHLQAQPDRTQAQLAKAFGVSIATISRWLTPMAMVGRECHIAAWVRPDGNPGGRWKALYRAGPGFNAKYPEPSRMAVYCKRVRNKALA